MLIIRIIYCQTDGLLAKNTQLPSPHEDQPGAQTADVPNSAKLSQTTQRPIFHFTERTPRDTSHGASHNCYRLSLFRCRRWFEGGGEGEDSVIPNSRDTAVKPERSQTRWDDSQRSVLERAAVIDLSAGDATVAATPPEMQTPPPSATVVMLLTGHISSRERRNGKVSEVNDRQATGCWHQPPRLSDIHQLVCMVSCAHWETGHRVETQSADCETGTRV